MIDNKSDDLYPMPEQIRYANILFFGAWLGIFIMILTYSLYVSEIVPPHTDLAVITQNWDKGVDEFLHITHAPHGWGWLNLMDKGDFLNFIGLVFLAVLTIICYLFLIIGYGRRGDWAYFIICILEVVVLAVAASGILGVSGH